MKFIILILFSSILVNEVMGELIGFIELVRHGARSTFSFTEKASQILIDTQKAQLTFNGYRQHQILGKILRKNYVEKHKLISSEYNPNEIEIFSTATQRTIFSATAQISGLFPNNIIKVNQAETIKLRNDDRPPFESEYLEVIEKNQIVLNINSEKKDLLFRPLRCRLPNTTYNIKSQFQKKNLFSFDKNETMNSIDEIKQKIPDLYKIKRKLDCDDRSRSKDVYSEDNIGEVIKYIIPVNYHFKNKKYIFSEKTEEFIRKKILNKWYAPRLKRNYVVKLSVSGLFDEFLNFFDKIVKNQTNSPKAKLFFGHDTNIVNIMSNLFEKQFLKEKINSAVKNITDFDYIIPQFAASFIFELHLNKETNQYYVKILYNGKELKENLFELKYDSVLEGIPYKDFKTKLNNTIDIRYKELNCSESKKKKSKGNKAGRTNSTSIDPITKNIEQDEEDVEVQEYLEISKLKKKVIRKFMTSIKLTS